MIIRKYLPTDCHNLAQLFYDTVHSIHENDYNKQQLDAWATGTVNLEEWNRSFLEHVTIVVEMDDRIVGFGDMDHTGYLDRLYVHKNYQRQGIATAICDALEQMVNADTVITHASITAKPFFERRGYQVLREQQVERHGVVLTNYVMRLSPKKDKQYSNC